VARVALDAAASIAPSTAWTWQVEKTAWFRNAQILAESFDFPPELGVDSSALRLTLAAAAGAESEWVYHPAVSPLFRSVEAGRGSIGAALHLAGWIAAHVVTDFGRVTLPDGLRLWTPQGSIELPAERLPLARIGTLMRPDAAGPTIGIDLFDTLLGLDNSPETEPADSHRLFSEQHICAYLASVCVVERSSPTIFDWLSGVARLVVPFRPSSSTTDFRSASDPHCPGLIRMDLGCGHLLTLEALVHESAHNYFYLTEAGGPIVAVDHAHLRFPSPLKPKPRPLRGVMLAYHALAYIAALYEAIAETGQIGDTAAFRQQFDDLRNAAADAEATCIASRQFLTERGREFLDETSNRVFHHAGKY
jgi:HEXXH motif-containing protein